MGMIGTLIGLGFDVGEYGEIQNRLVPAMAVALLTTLYGAFVANVMFMPMAKKIRGFYRIRS
jgi:chemotaxis protein MotA